jgi:DNA-binding NtrC family response regulator
MLPQARRAVIRAGMPALTAYLHTCVAVLEGNRGHLDEAWRHCDIAESLLEADSNAWVLATNFLNKGCIATIRCEFNAASEYFRKAAAAAEVSGSVRIRTHAETNVGYLQLVTGQFRKAEATLKSALSRAREPETRIGTTEVLARVYLAGGDLDQCERSLREANVCDDPIGYSEYGMRWAALTKAKLLLKRKQFDAALQWLAFVESRSTALQDRPFNVAVHLLAAHALHHLGNRRECAREILRSDSAGIRDSAELQGQLHYTLGMIVSGDDLFLARRLQKRAKDIWSTQRVVSVRAEIEDGSTMFAEPPTRNARTAPPSDRIRTVINSINAAIDLAGDPRLMGAELVSVLETVGCTANVSLRETLDASHEGFDGAARRMTLRLGDGGRAGKSIVLSCDAPASPADAIALGDIFRIGHAALALEKARQEERSRAALWPCEPVEEQAGALFLAEEMKTLLDTARRVAAANIPVLITGETGTGKEVLARLIHNYSPRAAKTFLPFNCSATPREMLDAQLFGHRRGAFTGATENFAGVIRAAGGGTLFLDEIGETTLDIQPKLLRFLESGEVHPIGETHPQRVDVRVVAATNADVDALVSQGRFREDLFYRLNIVRLTIPPLRERRVEIPAFANHYLRKYAKEMNKGELRLAEETMEYLVLYRWPGNVRQLANEMRRLAALAEPGAVLMPEHLSADIAASRRTMPAADRTLEASEIVVRIDQPFGAAIQHLERAMVQAALAKTRSVDEAAKLLGVSRKGLYLKRLRYGMEIERPKNGTEVA